MSDYQYIESTLAKANAKEAERKLWEAKLGKARPIARSRKPWWRRLLGI